MAKIPNHLQIKRKIPEVSGNINTSGAGSAAAIAQGLQDVSTTYSQVKREEADILHEGELAEANAQWLIAESKRRREAEDAEDFTQASDKYRQIDNDTLNIANIITRDDLREKFVNQKLARIEVGNSQIHDYVKGRQRDVDAADLATKLENLKTVYETTADESKRQASVISARQLIDAGVKRRAITASAGAKLKNTFDNYIQNTTLEQLSIKYVDDALESGKTDEQILSGLKGLPVKVRQAIEARLVRQRSLMNAAEAEEKRKEREAQLDAGDAIFRDIYLSGKPAHVDDDVWDTLGVDQQEKIIRLNEAKTKELEAQNNIASIKYEKDIKKKIEMYDTALMMGDLRFEDIPESDIREMGGDSARKLQAVQGSKDYPSGVPKYDIGAYQRMNDLLGQGETAKAKEFLQDNADKLGSQYVKLSDHIRGIEKDPESAKKIKELSTDFSKISSMFNKKNTERERWVKEEFEDWYVREQQTTGEIPSVTDRKEKRLELFKALKENEFAFGFADDMVDSQEEYKKKLRMSTLESKRGELSREIHIKRSAQITGMPVALIKRQIGKESNFDRNAESYTGVKGLHQITRDTAKDYGFDPDRVRSNNPADEEYQWKAYSTIMKNLIDKMGSIKGGILAYNTGPQNAKKILAGKMPSPIKHRGHVVKSSEEVLKEGVNYVKKIYGVK